MRIEIRSDSVILDGYVNVCARDSRELSSPQGPFIEQIEPKTFERALQKTDSVDLLFNHNPNRKLGSTKTGELSLHEDNIGLRALATVYDKEVMEKAEKGELRGWSFSFSALQDFWEKRSDGKNKRTVKEIELYEVSILDIQPAYFATSIEKRGEDGNTLTETRTEDFEAKVEDNSTKTEDKTEKLEETKQQEENRSNPDSHYFENLEKELILLQLKGGNSDK
jgi:HK97 family phage prohead protease